MSNNIIINFKTSKEFCIGYFDKMEFCKDNDGKLINKITIKKRLDLHPPERKIKGYRFFWFPIYTKEYDEYLKKLSEPKSVEFYDDEVDHVGQGIWSTESHIYIIKGKYMNDSPFFEYIGRQSDLIDNLKKQIEHLKKQGKEITAMIPELANEDFTSIRKDTLMKALKDYKEMIQVTDNKPLLEDNTKKDEFDP